MAPSCLFLILIVGLVSVVCISENTSQIILSKSYVLKQALHDIHDRDTTVEVESVHHQIPVMKSSRRIRTPTRPAPAANRPSRMGSPPAPEKPRVRLLPPPLPPPSS